MRKRWPCCRWRSTKSSDRPAAAGLVAGEVRHSSKAVCTASRADCRSGKRPGGVAGDPGPHDGQTKAASAAIRHVFPGDGGRRLTSVSPSVRVTSADFGSISPGWLEAGRPY